MKQIYPVFFFFLILLVIDNPTRAQNKLAIIGSSTSACFGINGDSCFVGRLKNSYGSTAQFNNLSVSGSSVYRGMPTSYVPPAGRNPPDTAHNITAALKNAPQVVLVNYPSNGYDQFSVAEVMFCLRTIRETAIQAGARCYITTTQPRSDPASYRTGETRRKMAAIKDSVLKEFGLFAINFWDEIVNPADSSIIPSLGQGDGTHLNEQGHRILFQKVRQKDIFSVNSPLPVKFIDFTASSVKGEVLLEWKTAQEENLQYYQVMRSEDGIHFKTIETIKSNNILQQNRYLFVDKTPFSSLNYYQVVAIGINNQPDYSKMVKVSVNQKLFSIQKLYYRNSVLFAMVESGEKQIINLQVLNSSGQVLAKMDKQVSAGSTSISLNVSLPRRAVYHMRISNSRPGAEVRSFLTE